MLKEEINNIHYLTSEIFAAPIYNLAITMNLAKNFGDAKYQLVIAILWSGSATDLYGSN